MMQSKPVVKDLTDEETREALMYMTTVKAESVRMKDSMIKQEKELAKKEGEGSLPYLDAILKIRAYDLLALEMEIEKSDLMHAVFKYSDK